MRERERERALILSLAQQHQNRVLTPWVFLRQHVSIYLNPPPWAGCDTRSILKKNKASLNSDLSFTKTGCLIKAKETYLPCYLHTHWIDRSIRLANSQKVIVY